MFMLNLVNSHLEMAFVIVSIEKTNFGVISPLLWKDNSTLVRICSSV